MGMVEELKRYFETTPREKVLADWAKTEKYDHIGPTCNEFLQYSERMFKRIKILSRISKSKVKKTKQY